MKLSLAAMALSCLLGAPAFGQSCGDVPSYGIVAPSEEPKALQNLLADCYSGFNCVQDTAPAPKTDALKNLLACETEPCIEKPKNVDDEKALKNLLACTVSGCEGQIVAPSEAPAAENLLACDSQGCNPGIISIAG